MADRITLQVVRYRPEKETEPTYQEYEVPCHKDWVVLDGLNYVKDQLDGTLSFRWSCRMGICGSCGMTVNGEPKLTCAAFLADYAPGPVRVEPLRNFPIIRDLVVDIGDFMRKLIAVNPMTRLVLSGLCSLSLFHWAHRFRHTLYDGLQIKHLNELIAIVCYGGAVAGSAVAAYLRWSVPAALDMSATVQPWR